MTDFLRRSAGKPFVEREVRLPHAAWAGTTADVFAAVLLR